MTNDPEFAEFADGEEPTRLDIPEQREPTMHPVEARLLKFLAERADTFLNMANILLSGDVTDDELYDARTLRSHARSLLDAIDAWKECK